MQKLESVFSVLTPREAEIARLLALGASTAEAGVALGIGEKTAHSHRAKILAKLKCDNVVKLARLAIAQGFVEMPT